MQTYTQEFNDHFALWQLEDHSPDWPAFRCDTASKLVRERAATMGGVISISHFILALDALRKEGAIRPVRALKPAEAEPTSLTVEEYRRLPASIIIRRYKGEPDFKADVDALIAAGKI